MKTYAQDTAVNITSPMFDARKGNLVLSDLDGWVFNGNDKPEFAAKELDTKDWKPMSPAQLTSSYSNSAGKASGWFRIKIKADSSVQLNALGIMNKSWSASEVYLNGRKIYSFGNPDTDPAKFRENMAFKKVPDVLSLLPGQFNTIAIKVVDPRPISADQLKTFSYDPNFRRVLMLTNQHYHEYYLNYWVETAFNDGLAISVTTILTVLFLIIYLLNPTEKNIRNFAIGSAFLAVLSIGLWMNTKENTSYWSYFFFDITNGISAILFISFVPCILAGVFEKRVKSAVMILLGVAILVIFGGMLYKNQLMFIAGSTIPILISAYYLLSNMGKLNRAKWSVVSGFLLSVCFLIIYIFAATASLQYQMSFILIYTLAPPLGMMGYVAFRFKEMITEVKANSEKIIQLSEEKRLHALNQQKLLEEKVEQRTHDLQNTLENLKSTQNQLIQAEKMASLGELTAGIAHEIQNPLNFVNNFAEVSKELLQEMTDELQQDNAGLASEIANDVIQNLEKIAHHGKRADSIVKGMLQHSRTNTGMAELTDINNLAEEYLQLAYHGLRAKDKTFNVTIQRHFDPGIGKIKVVPQDIGRVLLNLIMNACYAVSEKKQELKNDFSPTLTMGTSRAEDSVLIEVSDNGSGMPESIKDKIFQPFFTTKPTGSGTGLGLSLSYDIINSHGGTITVNSQPGKGTTFLLSIPIRV